MTDTTITGRVAGRLRNRWASAFALFVALLWTLPTFGLFVSSFRPEVDVKTNGWWNVFVDPQLTFDNYNEVLFSGSGSTGDLLEYFLNSLIITVPPVLLTLGVGSICAYVLSCTEFRGRDTIFIFIFVLQLLPLQMALIPLLDLFNSPVLSFLDAVPFARVWIAHAAFGLPLGIFLIHSFMSEVPAEIIDAAKMDGASHARIYWSVVLPLTKSALASYGTLQFLWIWNDLLVALVFVGGRSDVAPLTVRVLDFAGTRGSDWHLLTAAAFVSMIVPLVIFFALQRFLVRGVLAGSGK